MVIKGIKDEDFVNYKKASMFISFPDCTFKCDRENGGQYCQNMPLTSAPNIIVGIHELIRRYLDNPISQAIVCGGLEPLDSWNELWTFLWTLRIVFHCDDDVVIYTGYEPDEVLEKIDALKSLSNIIIKWGRFRPNQPKHFDEVLGVELASPNQRGEKIS